MAPSDCTPKTDVPYTCACRTDRAMLYPSDRRRVDELNLSWRRRITVVITRMMIETTNSSISVNPAVKRGVALRVRPKVATPRSTVRGKPLGLEKRRKYLEKIDMQKVGERGAEDKEGGEGHLAPHCIPSRERQEQYAHNRSQPKRHHERREARREPQQEPEPELQYAVGPAHPLTAGYHRERHEREREIYPREQPGKREPVFNQHKYERAERQKPHRAPRDYFVAQVVDENKKQYHPHRKRRGGLDQRILRRDAAAAVAAPSAQKKIRKKRH